MIELDMKFLLKLVWDTGECRVWNGSPEKSKSYLGDIYEPMGNFITIHSVHETPAPFKIQTVTFQFHAVQKNILNLISNAKFTPEYAELILLAKSTSPYMSDENFQVLKSYVGNWYLLPYSHSDDKIYVTTYFEC